MAKLGVDLTPPVHRLPRSHAMPASAIRLSVSLPLFYLAYLRASRPAALFVSWRGWLFAIVARACPLTAGIAPVRQRIAIAGVRRRRI